MGSGSYRGYVLTGGQSSRMGRDKALLPFGGRTLVEHVAGCVADAVGGGVTLVGSRDRYGHLGLAVIEDAYAGCGPLSGIAAALADSAGAGGDGCLVAACDLPLLDAGFLKELLVYAEERGDAAVVMPRGPSGYSQPLCAVYRQACLAAALEALGEGRLKVRDAFSDLHIAHWAVDDGRERALWNANTPEEWDRLGGRLSTP